MRQFASAEEFWNTERPGFPGKKIRSMLESAGDSAYSFDRYVRGPYGDRLMEYYKTWALYDGQDMHPDVLAYWRGYGKGLDKYLFEDETDLYRGWSAYVGVGFDF